MSQCSKCKSNVERSPFHAAQARMIQDAYHAHGTIRRAAEFLGMPKSTFADMCKRYGIATARISPSEEQTELVEEPIVGERPMLRSECRDMPRPCPYVTCRQHLAVTARNGSLIHLGGRKHSSKTLAPKASKQRFWEWSETALELLEEAPETCALDVAERGGATYSEIGALLGVTKSRIEQIVNGALLKLALEGEADAVE